MSLYNLDFSGWRQGNQTYAKGLAESETTRAKANAARARGLESGIGTIGGLLIGWKLGNPLLGAALGGKMIGGGQLDIKDLASLIGGLKGAPDAGDAGEAVDPNQVASASNTIGTAPVAKGGLLAEASPAAMYGQWDPTVFTK